MRLQRRHWVGPVAVAAAVTAVLLVWNRTSFVAEQVGRRFTDNLLRERGYRLEMRAVRGAPLGDLLLLGPVLTTEAEPRRTIARADVVRLRLRSWRGLLHGRVAIGRLRIERAELEWPLGGAAPQPAADTAPVAGPASYPQLHIDAVEIVDARIAAAGDGAPLAEHVDLLVQVRSSRERVEFEIDHGRGVLPRDSLHVEALRAEGVWSGDSLVVTDLDVATATSRLVGTGTLRPRRRLATAELQLDPLDLAELARFLPSIRQRGTVSGTLHADWRAPETRLAGTLAGTVDTWTVPDAAVDVTLGPDGVQIHNGRGTVAGATLDLQADLRAGRAIGTARFVDLDLHTLLPRQAASLPAHRLTGQATFARRAGGDSLRVQFELGGSQIDVLPIERAVGRVAWHGTDLHVDAAHVESPYGWVRGSGDIGSTRVDVGFDLETPSLGPTLALFGQRGPDGDLRLQGRVQGPRAAPQLEAEGDFTVWRFGAATARRGSLALWGHDLRQPRVDAELRADSLRIGPRRLHDLGADLALGGRTLRIVRAQASSGDTLIAAAGTVEPSSVDWRGTPAATTRLRLETLLLRLATHEMRVEEPADIWLRGSAVHVDSLRIVTRGGTARLDGSVDRAARTVDARAEAVGVDLAFVGGMLGAKAPLAGKAWGQLAASGGWDATRLEGDLHVTGGRWADLAIDSFDVVLTSGESSLELHEVHVATPHGAVRGGVELGRLPALARVWGDRSELRRDLGSARVSGTLQLRDVDVARWAARGDPLALPRWGGRVSADVTLAGTMAEPEITAVGQGDQVAFGPREIGSVDFDLGYADERLVVRRADIKNETEIVRVNGAVPMRIDLTHGIATRRDQPLEVKVVLPRSSFTLVQRFVPFFEPGLPGMEPGQVEAELDVGGTLAEPRVRGGFRVYDASFALRDMEEVYREVNAVGQFEGAKLVITELRARTGREGTVTGTQGWVTLNDGEISDYHYELTLARVPIYSLPDLTATVSGQLTVESARVGFQRLLVPSISGTLDVHEALITQEFGGAGDGEVFDTDMPEWLSPEGIWLRAPNGNVRLRNSQVEADLAGTLRAVRTRRQFDLQGELTVRRGRYLDLLNYFRITGGSLDFSAHPGFNPELDIHGETGRPGSRVYIHLTGSALAPRLSFRSEQEGVEGVAQIEEQVIDRIGSGGAVASQAVATVGGGLLRELQFLRGRDISVDPADQDPSAVSGDRRNEFGVNLSTGFAISDNAYLVYTQGVKSDIQQKAAVEIDLRRWPLLLEAAYERRNTSEGGPNQSQNAFDVNLKYRHEY